MINPGKMTLMEVLGPHSMETDQSRQSVSNEQRDVNNNVVLETDSEHTSGCSTCARSSSTSSCETDCSKCREEMKTNANRKKKLVKKGKKRKIVMILVQVDLILTVAPPPQQKGR